MNLSSRYIRLLDEVPPHVTIVVVSKQRTLEEIKILYDAGCRHFGENRIEEVLTKQEALGDLKDIQWHMVGTIQTKKAGKAAGIFSLIHSVDDLRLATKLSQKSLEKGIKSRVLLQVNVSGEENKHGWSEEAIRDCFQELLSLNGLEVQGFMTMAVQDAPQEDIRKIFRCLSELKQELCPDLPYLSMGMSQDYRIAIEEGANLVRIGSAIFTG